jgi:hypothetical protein
LSFNLRFGYLDDLLKNDPRDTTRLVVRRGREAWLGVQQFKNLGLGVACVGGLNETGCIKSCEPDKATQFAWKILASDEALKPGHGECLR